MARHNNTYASKTIVSSGNLCGFMGAMGYDGTAYEYVGAIYFSVDGTPGEDDMPGRIGFFTTPNGSTTLAERMRIDNAGVISAYIGITPDANDGAYLGTSSLGWSDLFLAEGGVINWDNGDVTLTQTGNELALAGGNLALGSNSITMSGSIGVTGTRVLKGWFTDLECTNAIAASITGNAATVTAADEASDTSCYLGFVTAATGSLGLKTNTSLILNSATRCITVTSSTNDGSTNILDLKDSDTTSVHTIDSDGRVTKVKTLGYGAVYDIGNSSTAFTITLSNGQHQKVTMTGDAAMTIVDTGNIGDGNWSLEVIQDGTGGNAITSGTVSGGTVRTAGGTDPALSTAANAVDTIVIQKRGTVYTVSLAEKGLATWS